MSKMTPKTARKPAGVPGVAQTDAGSGTWVLTPERFRERIRETKRVRAGDIEPHPLNPRTHGGEQMGAVTGMLVEVGKFRPLIAFPADGLGPAGDFSRLMYADGHCREKINPDEVWTVCVTDLTRAEADKALFADRTGELAGYDPATLDVLLREVNTGCAELQQMLDDLWTEAQAAAIADTEPGEPADAEPQVDRAAELAKLWQTAPGQLWLLSDRHRLLVGDCRKPEDVARAVGDWKVNVAFTSPPYASQRKYDESSGFVPIKPEDYVAWWELVQANVRKHLAADGSFFVNIKPHCEDGERTLYVFDLVCAMVRKYGWKFVDELCWKNSGTPKAVERRFKNQFEPVYHFTTEHEFRFRPDAVKVPTDREFVGDGRSMAPQQGVGECVNPVVQPHDGMAYPGNVVAVNFDKANSHSATFPIGLPSFFIRAFSDEGDVILDPFCGSGTVIMACSNLNRRAVGIELSPKYAGVILQRFKDAFPDAEIRKAP